MKIIKRNGADELQFLDSYAKIDALLERVASVRESCGKDFGIAIDFHGRVHKPMAKIVAKKLEEFDPMFIEEPVLCDNMEYFPEIAAACNIPIATGERLFTKYDFKRLLAIGGVDIVQPDLSHAGGLTECKKIAAMAEAFEGADIVIPKSWAPFAAMEKRTNLYAEGDDAGIAALEKELLAQNATHQDWCSTTELMEKTANGQDTIFMHPLPADISGVSCEHGEVNADVFDMHRVGMYKEASYKPYAIAAMMFLQKVADPAATLKALDERNTARWLQA